MIMVNIISKIKSLVSWLTKNNVAGPWPVFDRMVFLFRRIGFISTKIVQRLLIGKERRDELYAHRHLDEAWSPSYKLIRAFFRTLKPFKVKRPHLIRIVVPQYDYMFYVRPDKEDLATYEHAIFELFKPKQQDIFIDIGAHIGRYSLIAAKRVGSWGRVISIEAHPENFEILMKNIALNRLYNVTAVNSVVTSEKGKAKLYQSGHDQGFTIYNTIMTQRATASEDFLEVEANTLDNILESKNIKEVNWIKIDVEGAELEVLKGASKTLKSNQDLTLLVEVHGEANYKPILEIFQEYRFKIDYEQKYYPSNDRHILARKLAALEM
jgi:FkbM family methyltransferase